MVAAPIVSGSTAQLLNQELEMSWEFGLDSSNSVSTLVHQVPGHNQWLFSTPGIHQLGQC